MSVVLDARREYELLNQTRNDLTAFQEIYDSYLPRVYAYVSFRVGRVQDTEDIVSGVFLKVLERLEHFEWRGTGSFSAWLFRIVHNGVADYYRHHLNEEIALSLSELPDLVPSHLLPDDQLLQKEKFTRLRALITTLSPRRKEIIALRFYGALSNKEIAQVLGLDEHTIASHLCRGIEDLHHLYVNEFLSKEGV